MDLTPEEPDNIIAINADAAKYIEIRQKEQKKKYACSGQHKHIEVDPIKRVIVCTHCGFTVDPFDYLDQWAVEGERRMQGLKTIDIKLKIARAEHDDLMRKIKNMRQTLKRHGQPQPELERRQYDQDRDSAGYV